MKSCTTVDGAGVGDWSPVNGAVGVAVEGDDTRTVVGEASGRGVDVDVGAGLADEDEQAVATSKAAGMSNDRTFNIYPT